MSKLEIEQCAFYLGYRSERVIDGLEAHTCGVFDAQDRTELFSFPVAGPLDGTRRARIGALVITLLSECLGIAFQPWAVDLGLEKGEN